MTGDKPDADESSGSVLNGATEDGTVTRPLVDDLEDVDSAEWIYRFVDDASWDHNPADKRTYIQSGFIQSREYKRTDDSYGPSVWMQSKLPGGDATCLEALHPKLADKGLVLVPVREVLACKIRVKASPQDAKPPLDRFDFAHASLVDIDKNKRDDLVEICQNYIVRHPKKKNGTP